MRKPKIKFNKIKPRTNTAKALVSIAKFGDISRVYSKNKKSLLKSLDLLIKKGLIKPVIKNDSNENKVFLLTKEGFIEFLKLELSQTNLLSDNRECMVIFDIPEISKSLRKILTIFLEDSCFIRLQKSVWVSPFDATNLLSEVFYLSSINKLVRVFTVEEVVSPQNKVDRPYFVTDL